ncbi:hypothetical protein [Chitinophaga tropicalis]|uniref:Uncharacterized protein n=1 Tax=Chitinophaga tropicalis TaxID=2683588 RepID=A0A7K1U8H4_9BACT|nr:hypothetical protein [Chitinophaga tropicalis]MVT10295.1 hypothetical protein [Chitinophaga tropicalis]
MKQHIFLLIMILSMAISSCKKSDTDKENEAISTGMEKLALKKNTNWLVILPGAGCKGCIQEGEAFMRDFIDNPQVMFVLTNTKSFKILQQKTGISLKEHDNVYVDKDRLFDMPTNNAIYPCIVQLDNGKPVKHQFQSPQSGQAFEGLRVKLSND